MSSTSPGPEQQALLDALQDEYAAVFAYGIVAAFSNTNRTDLVAANTAAHRARRDATLDALAAADVDAPEPEAGYTIPFAVTDPVSPHNGGTGRNRHRRRLAVGRRTQPIRAHPRGGRHRTHRGGSARAANWRAILGEVPATTAFPGRA